MAIFLYIYYWIKSLLPVVGDVFVLWRQCQDLWIKSVTCAHSSVVSCLYYSCVHASVPVYIYTMLKKSDDLYPGESLHVPADGPCPQVS
jgi:hypothetical protein